MNRLSCLAGADLDILFGGGGGGVDLLTDSLYTHITTASLILSVEVIWACLFTNILSMSDDA